MFVKDWNDRPKRLVLWKCSVGWKPGFYKKVPISTIVPPNQSDLANSFPGFLLLTWGRARGNPGNGVRHRGNPESPSQPFLSRRLSNIPPHPTMNYLATNSFRTRTITVIGLNRERNVVRMRAAVCWVRDETKTAARENRWSWAPSFKLDNAFHRINYSTVDKC